MTSVLCFCTGLIAIAGSAILGIEVYATSAPSLGTTLVSQAAIVLDPKQFTTD